MTNGTEMTISAEGERLIGRHLSQIEARLTDSGAPLAEREQILEDLDVQIREMIAEEAGHTEATAGVIRAVLDRLDPPEAYMTRSTEEARPHRHALTDDATITSLKQRAAIAVKPFALYWLLFNALTIVYLVIAGLCMERLADYAVELPKITQWSAHLHNLLIYNLFSGFVLSTAMFVPLFALGLALATDEKNFKRLCLTPRWTILALFAFMIIAIAYPAPWPSAHD